MTTPSPAMPHGIPPDTPEETPPGEPSRLVLRIIRACGHLCLIGILVFWVMTYKIKGEPYEQVWQLVLAQLFAGRAGGVTYGLQNGFSPWYLLFHCMMYDFIIMLYVYPFFVTGYQMLTKVPFIGKTLDGVHTVAVRHKSQIEPYGVIGLIVFVFFPFWSTGPLVGVVVGYLIGLRTWVTFTSVIVGNIAAIALWILAYDSLRNYSEKLAITLLCIIFMAAMGGGLIAKLKRKKKSAEAEEKEEDKADTKYVVPGACQPVNMEGGRNKPEPPPSVPAAPLSPPPPPMSMEERVRAAVVENSPDTPASPPAPLPEKDGADNSASES